ncbi:MAG TPA: nuclear transport factor 2 family protein [Solirubrobacterales bacterium]|nr:nuclear transport factor 2 family protein [Solirubrobacterales bacterium]
MEQVFEAVQQNDPDRLLQVLHPSVEWTPTVWSGDAMYRGQEGVHLWLSQFGEELEHLDIRVRDVESEGKRTAVRGIVFDTRGAQTFAVEVCWSFEIEQGRVRRGRAHDSWSQALRAAGLE